MTKKQTLHVDKDATKRDLFIIDGSAPFFEPCVDGSRKNWSKAPLEDLLVHGKIPAKLANRIDENVRIYCRRVDAVGYNAITFDDLAHITLFDFYPYMLSRSVHAFQKLFRRVFKIAKKEGLQIYVTTDIMFCNRYIESRTHGKDSLLRELFVEALERLFDMFPEVDGVVTRIGEPDGVDVNSAFKSRLVICSARQCNRWLQAILTVVEAHEKQLVFRTWGLGAYSVGDINWNGNTQKRAFADIDTSAFIVSHKYGPGDFFRYLPLNDFMMDSPHKQIIELQARREYEGFGMFPAYVGRQYEQFRDQLQDCPTLCGISVWCQTGGWSHFDRLTFLETSSPWNELNAIAAVQLFSGNRTAGEIVTDFCAQRFETANPEKITEIVALFDMLIDHLWYFVPFAQNSLWFRRLRVPPLLWIFWDTILVNRALRLVFKTFQPDRKTLRQKDRQQRKVLRRLSKLIKELPGEEEDLRMGVATFALIINLRRFYLGSAGKKRERKVKEQVQKYRQEYPSGFAVECDFSPFRIRWMTSGLLFGFFIRRQSRYRPLDRILLIPLTSWMFPVFKRWQRRRIPDIAESQTAGLELFFR